MKSKLFGSDARCPKVQGSIRIFQQIPKNAKNIWIIDT